MVLEIIDINLSLPTDEIIEFLIVKHEEPLLINHLGKTFADEASLML